LHAEVNRDEDLEALQVGGVVDAKASAWLLLVVLDRGDQVLQVRVALARGIHAVQVIALVSAETTVEGGVEEDDGDVGEREQVNEVLHGGRLEADNNPSRGCLRRRLP
jgi:hypothetical protein